MVVTQLEERLLLTLTEVRGLNRVIDKMYIERLLSLVLKFEKKKIKEKNEDGNGPFLF